jgi:HlyD family secretion protein
MKGKALYVVLGVVVIAVVAGLAYVFFWQSRSTAVDDADTRRPAAVRAATVERGTMLVAIPASGRIEALEQVDLVFQIPGRVDDVLVEVGDAVAAGETLARLDAARLTHEATQARAALTSAEARLAQLRRAARPEEIAAAEANVQAAEAQVNAASANLAQLLGGASAGEIAAAEAEFASAQANQKAAFEAYQMTLKCFTVDLPHGMGEREICPALGAPEEQARFNLAAADSALEAAYAGLDALTSGTSVDAIRAARANVAVMSAQQDAAQARLDLLLEGATGGQIAAAEAQVEQARAAWDMAELALTHATLAAPFDGVVAAVNVTAGEMAAGGPLPAVTLLDTSAFCLVVQVDEIDVGKLAVGQEARVTLDGLPQADLVGRVERISPAATIEGGVVYYETMIRLAETDAPVRVDMSANATIVVEELTDVLMIPTWVVRIDPETGQTYVERRVDGAIVRADVVVGARHEGIAEIVEGLSEGDEVVWVRDDRFFTQ